MLDPKNVINAINKSLELFFKNGKIGYCYLSYHKGVNVFRLSTDYGYSIAYDSYGNDDGREVKVIKWFNDFWLFIEIAFQHPEGIIVTLSVFQGEEANPYKTQLFRAEWDDYGDNKFSHPQPHWHFINNKYIENAVISFAEIIPEAGDTFEELLTEEKNKMVDMSKFHFAMYGGWKDSMSHIHKIDNDFDLAKWFGGLLAHLITELKYIDRKRGNSVNLKTNY